jgi:hypothetical protein
MLFSIKFELGDFPAIERQRMCEPMIQSEEPETGPERIGSFFFRQRSPKTQVNKAR